MTIIILLTCGHWTDGGTDVLLWLNKKRAYEDIRCYQCPGEGGRESYVRTILTKVQHIPLWTEEATWLDQKETT